LPEADFSGANALSVSPPDRPMPPLALGCPEYVIRHGAAVLGPRQYWLPPPMPFSELMPTRLALETWIEGSPALLVPQPVAPTVWTCN
jgi:hypothetical protein